MLIVEVSDATLHFDRKTKLPLYAAAGIPEYWLLNLVDRQLEVHRSPRQAPDGAWAYTDTPAYAASQSITPLAAPGFSVRITDMLP